MPAWDSVKSPDKLRIWNSILAGIWRALSAYKLIVQTPVICMRVAIRLPQVLWINFVQNLLLPKNKVRLLPRLRNQLHITFHKRCMHQILICPSLSRLGIRHAAGRLDLPSWVHEHLLGEQQVLFCSIHGDGLLFMRKEHFGNSVCMVDKLILHLLIFAVSLFVFIRFNQHIRD